MRQIQRHNPDDEHTLALIGVAAAGLALWVWLKPPEDNKPPKAAGSLTDDVLQETGLDAKVNEAVQYVAQEATKGAVAAVKEEVQKYTMPAAIAGAVLGFGIGYLLRGK